MKRSAIAAALLCASQALAPAVAQTASITASKPTHYFYVPAAYVNDPFELVVSLHEISFSLPAHLQLQASLFDNIGRVNFGAKFGPLSNLAIGAGLASSLVHIGRGTHGIPRWATPRLGLYLAWGFLQLGTFEMDVVPHTQIGDRVSVGADLGLMVTPHEFWSIIWEAGTSVDLHDALLYINTDAGVRIHPPVIPFLSFDLGIDLEEFPVVEGVRPSATVYFDVIFAMQVR